MAVKGHEALVPRDLGQVVLVRVVEIEGAAEGAAGRRCADVVASTTVLFARHISIGYLLCLSLSLSPPDNDNRVNE